jgi:hypothetical protein
MMMVLSVAAIDLLLSLFSWEDFGYAYIYRREDLIAMIK